MADVQEVAEGLVRGALHRPFQESKGILVLAHGAGANRNAPLLQNFAQAFCEAGYWVLRCDLAFRQKRPTGPPLPAWAKEDQAGLRAAVNFMRPLAPGRVILGGHSYGGRQATMLASDDPGVADALLLLSYPLHPPRRPEQLRTGHWPSLATPSFFVHGSRDPFGSPEEMREALQLVPAPTELLIRESAGHDLAHGRFPIADLVIEPLRKFVERGQPLHLAEA